MPPLILIDTDGHMFVAPGSQAAIPFIAEVIERTEDGYDLADALLIAESLYDLHEDGNIPYINPYDLSPEDTLAVTRHISAFRFRARFLAYQPSWQVYVDDAPVRFSLEDVFNDEYSCERIAYVLDDHGVHVPEGEETNFDYEDKKQRALLWCVAATCALLLGNNRSLEARDQLNREMFGGSQALVGPVPMKMYCDTVNEYALTMPRSLAVATRLLADSYLYENTPYRLLDDTELMHLRMADKSYEWLAPRYTLSGNVLTYEWYKDTNTYTRLAGRLSIPRRLLENGADEVQELTLVARDTLAEHMRDHPKMFQHGFLLGARGDECATQGQIAYIDGHEVPAYTYPPFIPGFDYDICRLLRTVPGGYYTGTFTTVIDENFGIYYQPKETD